MKGSVEIFDGKVFLGFQKWTKKMSKNEKGRFNLANSCHETIIEIYGLVTLKIFFILL
jgi:hypothetical protein